MALQQRNYPFRKLKKDTNLEIKTNQIWGRLNKNCGQYLIEKDVYHFTPNMPF